MENANESGSPTNEKRRESSLKRFAGLVGNLKNKKESHNSNEKKNYHVPTFLRKRTS